LSSGTCGLWGNESQLRFPFGSRPQTTEAPATKHPLPDAELHNAFVGTPVTKSSQKCSRLLDLVVHPIPSSSPAEGVSWQSPRIASTSFMASSPLRSNTPGFISKKHFSGASELNLLVTPLVVKVCIEKNLKPIPTVDTCKTYTYWSVFAPFLFLALITTTSMLLIVNLFFYFFFFYKKVTEEDKVLSGPSPERHRHGVVEDAWSESRRKTTLFAPEDDHAELEESSESTPGEGLEKMDVSKENRTISPRSDQTTLEYHDAK
ncbi:ELYS protein, partial [Rostratula benghalensis]|nr:ELYS protein [Rostratula benghalensis]